MNFPADGVSGNRGGRQNKLDQTEKSQENTTNKNKTRKKYYDQIYKVNTNMFRQVDYGFPARWC